MGLLLQGQGGAMEIWRQVFGAGGYLQAPEEVEPLHRLPEEDKVLLLGQGLKLLKLKPKLVLFKTVSWLTFLL
jgi:hypothetical protein